MGMTVTVAGATGGEHFEVQPVRPESLPGGLARPFDWLERTADRVDIAALHARHPGVGWTSFERWAEGQDFRKLTGTWGAS